jgi:hypothetical protein
MRPSPPRSNSASTRCSTGLCGRFDDERRRLRYEDEALLQAIDAYEAGFSRFSKACDPAP